MTCPKAGVWRAWLDRAPEDPGSDLGGHLADCPACQAIVGDLRGNAAVAGRAIGGLAPIALPAPAAIELALARQPRVPVAAPAHSRPPRTPESGTQNIPREKRQMALIHGLRRWRVVAGGLAAALILSVLIGTPQGRTATAQFLAQFRGQHFAVITIDPSQRASGLAQLERLGTLQGNGLDRPTKTFQTVATMAEASQRVGFPLQQPDPAALPAGLNPTPIVQVAPATEYRLTFDRAKAAEYFKSTGHPELSLPEKFNGVSLVVGVPAGALLRYNDQAGTPALTIGQAGELTVGVEGQVTLDELRDYLLGLPGLSPDTVRQLRAIEDWRNTLPIPIPADQVNWQQTSIAGGQGLIFADNSGLGSAALWQRDSRVYGIFGLAKTAEIQRVADSLQ